MSFFVYTISTGGNTSESNSTSVCTHANLKCECRASECIASFFSNPQFFCAVCHLGIRPPLRIRLERHRSAQLQVLFPLRVRNRFPQCAQTPRSPSPSPTLCFRPVFVSFSWRRIAATILDTVTLLSSIAYLGKRLSVFVNAC